MTQSALHMLDTNMVNHIIKGDESLVLGRLTALPMSDIVVSSVTQAELLYGLAKCGNLVGLAARLREFFVRVDVLSWDSQVASVYGELRTSWEAAGVSLGDMDMMIAAHAVTVNATLVTRDQVFLRIPDRLIVNQWDQT